MAARFLSPFRIELVEGQDQSNDGRGSWRMCERFGVYSEVLRRELWTPAGFVTDLASIPRLPLVFLRYGDRAHRAVVPHDQLYTTHEVDRLTADNVFLELMLATNVPPDIAHEMFRAVRMFGGRHWDEPGQPQILAVAQQLEAP